MNERNNIQDNDFECENVFSTLKNGNKKVKNKHKKLNFKDFFMNFHKAIIILIILGLSLVLIINGKGIIKGVKTILNSLGIYTEVIKSVSIPSSDFSEPGSFYISKYAKWTGIGEAQINYRLTTKTKTNDDRVKNYDIVLALDVSTSMSGKKIEGEKSKAVDYINEILSDSNNTISLIEHHASSSVLSDFTNDKEKLTEIVNNLELKCKGEVVDGVEQKWNSCTNYYATLKKVEDLLKNYSASDDRQLVVLYITDGDVNSNVSLLSSEYELLKKKYPDIIISGIQYEMAREISSGLKAGSDDQYFTLIDNLASTLSEATYRGLIDYYEKFTITDYINTDLFYIDSEDDIKVSGGTATLQNEGGEQKVVVNFNRIYTSQFWLGSPDLVSIKVKLKNDYLGSDKFLPLMKNMEIVSKLSKDSEKKTTSNKTPVLKNSYDVYYDVNTPDGCNLASIPKESHYVFENITKRDDELVCNGYVFKGWDIDSYYDELVTKINDDTFVMPDFDITFRATWTKQEISKTMDGTVFQKETLYKVLEREATTGGLAREYLGPHQDSISGTGTKKIYHYYVSNEYELNQLKNKTNVKFAGLCWRMVRTTDTGGVKMYFYGKPDSSGWCTQGGSSFTEYVTFNRDIATSLASVGYMYNNVYKNQSKSVAKSQSVMTWEYTSTDYWVADDISYDSTTKKYTLVNPYKVDDYADTKGKYTLRESSEFASNSTAFYIVGNKNSTIYCIKLKLGEKLEDKEEFYTFGDSYTKNADGTLTINNAKTMKTSEYVKNSDNIKGKYLCKNATGNKCDTIVYVYNSMKEIYAYATSNNENSLSFTYVDYNQTIKFGNNFTYSNGVYKINNTGSVETIDAWKDTNLLKNAHYTCFNSSGECSDIAYIYKLDSYDDSFDYILLSGGKNIDSALNDMLKSDAVNKTDSEAKVAIDKWYENNLIDYAAYLEDTVFCNGRNITNLGAFNPNGGELGAALTFKQNDQSDLSCPNVTDRFSISNDKAKLKYPVALMTKSELELLNIKWVGYNGDTTLLLAPAKFEMNNVFAYYFTSGYGGLTFNLASGSGNGRAIPAISLAPGIEYVSGDGSQSNPYIIDTSNS